MKFKNFKRYEPIEKSFGESAIYLKSEEGQDWYSCQELFALDSLKIVYDQNGLIISQSRDVSSLFPIDASVAEINTKLTDVLGLYFLKGQLIETPKPSEHHQWDGKAWVISKEKLTALLNEQRAEMWERIKQKRHDNLRGGVYVQSVGKWFHSNDESRQQYTFLRTLNALPPNLKWKTMDNSFVHVTKAILDKLSLQLVLDEQADFTNAERHKALMEQAETPLDYDFSDGWTETFAEVINE